MQLTEAVNEQCVRVSKIHTQVWHITIRNIWVGNFCFLDIQLASLLSSSPECGRSGLRAGSFAIYEPNLANASEEIQFLLLANIQTNKSTYNPIYRLSIVFVPTCEAR